MSGSRISTIATTVSPIRAGTTRAQAFHDSSKGKGAAVGSGGAVVGDCGAAQQPGQGLHQPASGGFLVEGRGDLDADLPGVAGDRQSGQVAVLQ